MDLFLEAGLSGAGGRKIPDATGCDLVLGEGVGHALADFGSFVELGGCWRLIGISG